MAEIDLRKLIYTLNNPGSVNPAIPQDKTQPAIDRIVRGAFGATEPGKTLPAPAPLVPATSAPLTPTTPAPMPAAPSPGEEAGAARRELIGLPLRVENELKAGGGSYSVSPQVPTTAPAPVAPAPTPAPVQAPAPTGLASIPQRATTVSGPAPTTGITTPATERSYYDAHPEEAAAQNMYDMLKPSMTDAERSRDFRDRMDMESSFRSPLQKKAIGERLLEQARGTKLAEVGAQTAAAKTFGDVTKEMTRPEYGYGRSVGVFNKRTGDVVNPGQQAPTRPIRPGLLTKEYGNKRKWGEIQPDGSVKWGDAEPVEMTPAQSAKDEREASKPDMAQKIMQKKMELDAKQPWLPEMRKSMGIKDPTLQDIRKMLESGMTEEQIMGGEESPGQGTGPSGGIKVDPNKIKRGW